MLVLSRKQSQKIRIGENVTVTVVKIDKNAVRIGIDAPDEVSVCREELLDDARVPHHGHDTEARDRQGELTTV